MTTTFGLITGLTWFWFVRGTQREIRSWLERALERFDSATQCASSRSALLPVLVLAMASGDLAAAERAFSQAVAEAHDLDVPRLESSWLRLLADFAMMRGDLARAAAVVCTIP